MDSQIFISSDHAGIKLKSFLLLKLKEHLITNLGPYNEDSVDYPDFADLVCKKLESTKKLDEINPQYKGILICGSGQGMVMRANKYPFIRAGLCHNPDSARLIREHNNANVLCLAARSNSDTNDTKAEVQLFNNALNIVKVFLETPFQAGRHSKRITKLHKPIN